jgi:hypothetical protein
MAYVACALHEGLRPSEATIEVADFQGNATFLRVPREYLKEQQGQFFLPIGIVYDDAKKEEVLIKLPHEADSGVNRLWILRSSLFDPRPQAEVAYS